MKCLGVLLRKNLCLKTLSDHHPRVNHPPIEAPREHKHTRKIHHDMVHLIGKAKTAQPVLKTEDVPVGGEHQDGHTGVAIVRVGHFLSGRRRAVEAAAVNNQLQLGGVDAREVASTGGLDVLRLEGEGVAVDELHRDVGVVLVRLDQAEVAALLGVPAVGVVEQQVGANARVDGQAGHAPRGARKVEPLVVARLLRVAHDRAPALAAVAGARQDVRSVGLMVLLADDPEEFHDGVVKVQVNGDGAVIAHGTR